ncbi:hypothetical protein KSF_085840 [Reticulibacter mediterranei]|uniref:NACHT domain-containing protein n=1 Tax=Reticulibacter mediterranei TaxID=2778369 RepID=A0A8J3IYT7_9CHLR|nr:NACHT domain-containing protein [Reticulibacter mediterranei]GHO98536.1 hypothetical protein KSF_085840 [Reticulibacter mediterranei]
MSRGSPNNSSFFNRMILTLFRFLIAVGVPLGAGWTFAQTVTSHIWLAIIITLVYEFSLLLSGFFGEVWQKLKNPLVDWVVKNIQWQAQVIFSHYKRHYRQYIIYEHQVFDVKGLSTRAAHDLELEHVFVELVIEPTPAHQASEDLLKVAGQLHSKHDQDIWHYLTSSSLMKQHFVIVGPPGSGKTTLLKHIALQLAQEKGKQNQRIHKLPIFLYLREHAEMIKDKPDYSLVEAMQNHIRRKWQQVIPEQWILSHLKRGKCLILLDGLDEVADTKVRKQVVEWVQQQILAYGNNRFILTSRPYGYRGNPIDGVTILETRPFTLKQIERFIQRWYLANELKSWGKEDPGVHMRARSGAEDLLQRLRQTPPLLALAINPLLLTMITTVHRYRGSLPGKRVALYGEICEVFLGKRREAIGVAQELSPAQKQQVLQPLAYYMMRQGKQAIPVSEACNIIASPLQQVSTTRWEPKVFLQMVQETSGIFIERDPDLYSFAHKTFQEYLAAVHIKEHQLEKTLLDEIESGWWHETIRLYCALADASTVLVTCLAKSQTSLASLILAIGCHEEALKVDPDIRLQFENLLKQGFDDIDPERRKIVTEAMLSQRLQKMIKIDDALFMDNSLISCAEYQLFIDAQKIQGTSFQPDHWTIDHFLQGDGKKPILGVRPTDALAFCEWLTKRTLDGRTYRLPTIKENDKININNGYWIKGNDSFLLSENSYHMLETIRKNDIYVYVKDALETVLNDESNINKKDDKYLQNKVHITIIERRMQESNYGITFTGNLTANFISALKYASYHTPPSRLKQTFNFDRTFDFASSLAHVMKNDQILATISDADLASTLGLDRDIGLKQARERSQARHRLEVINSTLARAIDRTLGRKWKDVLYINWDGLFNLDHNFIRTFHHTSLDIFDQELFLTLESIRNYAFDAKRFSSKKYSPENEELAFLRWYVRLLAQMLATYLLYWSERKKSSKQYFISLMKWIGKPSAPLTPALTEFSPLLHESGWSQNVPTNLSSTERSIGSNFLKNSLFKSEWRDSEEVQRAIDSYLDIYIAFALIEGRVQHLLKPCEGILVVGEN